MLAVKYALSSFGHILENQSIQVNIDNISACQIFQKHAYKISQLTCLIYV